MAYPCAPELSAVGGVQGYLQGMAKSLFCAGLLCAQMCIRTVASLNAKLVFPHIGVGLLLAALVLGLRPNGMAERKTSMPLLHMHAVRTV